MDGRTAFFIQGVQSGLRLSFVDLDFGSSAAYPILLGQLQIWRNWHGMWPRWWNTQIKVNKIVSDLTVHPVASFRHLASIRQVI